MSNTSHTASVITCQKLRLVSDDGKLCHNPNAVEAFRIFRCTMLLDGCECRYR